VSIDIRNNEYQLLPKNTTGNIWVKSNQSFNSYLHTTHSISSLNGYLGINDRGFLDEAGRLFFSGRKEGYISIRGHTVDIELLEYWIKTYLSFENLSLFALDMEASETSLVLISENELSLSKWKTLKAEIMKVHGKQAVPSKKVHCPQWPFLENGKTGL